MLVLKRLDDAERDGNTVYAVIGGDRTGADGTPLPDRSDLRLGIGTGVDGGISSVTHLFGHAHAASGLVHVAAAVVALRHRVGVGNVPLIASNHESGDGLPPGAGPRTVSVETTGLDGIARRSLLLAEATDHLAPSRIAAPRLHIFSGVDAAAVLADLDAGRESDVGPARLVIVAAGPEQFAARSRRARRHIDGGHPAGRGRAASERRRSTASWRSSSPPAGRRITAWAPSSSERFPSSPRRSPPTSRSVTSRRGSSTPTTTRSPPTISGERRC